MRTICYQPGPLYVPDLGEFSMDPAAKSASVDTATGNSSDVVQHDVDHTVDSIGLDAKTGVPAGAPTIAVAA